MRRRLAVPAILGALGLIWALAHALTHGLVAKPTAGGHQGGAVERYLAFLPTSVALCLALALAVAAGARLGRRWTGSVSRSLWLFGVVPVLGFAVDVVIELPVQGHATVSGTTALVLELAPALLVGLVVQIPFALAALGLASRILQLAEGLARALCAPRGATALAGATPGGRAWDVLPGPLCLAGSSHSRAPPA